MEAQTELQDSVSFYRDQAGDQLAEAFKSEVKVALQTLSEDPERSPHLRDIPELQRLLLSRFPFGLIYTNLPDEVVVIAVAHGNRFSRYWADRL
jgi:plasmid stabilization system protein ParE